MLKISFQSQIKALKHLLLVLLLFLHHNAEAPDPHIKSSSWGKKTNSGDRRAWEGVWSQEVKQRWPQAAADSRMAKASKRSTCIMMRLNKEQGLSLTHTHKQMHTQLKSSMSRGQSYLAKHKAPLLTRVSDENPKQDLTTGSPRETAESSSAHTILCFMCPRVCVCARPPVSMRPKALWSELML